MAPNLIEEDHCRVAEHLKKQPHKRLQAATSDRGSWSLLVSLAIPRNLNCTPCNSLMENINIVRLRELKLPTM